jgi:hypothetical protein
MTIVGAIVNRASRSSSVAITAGNCGKVRRGFLITALTLLLRSRYTRSVRGGYFFGGRPVSSPAKFAQLDYSFAAPQLSDRKARSSL